MANTGATTAGASQLREGVDLSALNKSSAKVATFVVRLVNAKDVQYTYRAKRDGTQQTANKFEIVLVGMDPKSYCIGYVKGSEQDIVAARKIFANDSVWSLSKVVLDTYTSPAYINTPLPYRVDLNKSTMMPRNTDGAIDKQLRSQLPMYPVPPRSVAEISRITTNRATDLIAVVKSYQKERTNKNGQDILDVTLIDDSETEPGKLATVVVSLWGATKIAQVKTKKGEAMVFFNLSVSCSDGKPQINHYADERAENAPPCEKTDALDGKKDVLTSATNTEQLTDVWAPQHTVRDVSGPQPLSCAAFLDFTSEAPQADMPSVVQLCWVHLEEPEPDTDVVVGGERIWYTVSGRDLSGSTTLAVPQRHALLLASCQAREEFLQKHKAASVLFGCQKIQKVPPHTSFGFQ